MKRNAICWSCGRQFEAHAAAPVVARDRRAPFRDGQCRCPNPRCRAVNQVSFATERFADEFPLSVAKRGTR